MKNSKTRTRTALILALALAAAAALIPTSWAEPFDMGEWMSTAEAIERNLAGDCPDPTRICKELVQATGPTGQFACMPDM